jgi:hypothetical protein
MTLPHSVEEIVRLTDERQYISAGELLDRVQATIARARADGGWDARRASQAAARRLDALLAPRGALSALPDRYAACVGAHATLTGNSDGWQLATHRGGVRVQWRREYHGGSGGMGRLSFKIDGPLEDVRPADGARAPLASCARAADPDRGILLRYCATARENLRRRPTAARRVSALASCLQPSSCGERQRCTAIGSRSSRARARCTSRTRPRSSSTPRSRTRWCTRRARARVQRVGSVARRQTRFINGVRVGASCESPGMRQSACRPRARAW